MLAKLKWNKCLSLWLFYANIDFTIKDILGKFRVNLKKNPSFPNICFKRKANKRLFDDHSISTFEYGAPKVLELVVFTLLMLGKMIFLI